MANKNNLTILAKRLRPLLGGYVLNLAGQVEINYFYLSADSGYTEEDYITQFAYIHLTAGYYGEAKSYFRVPTSQNKASKLYALVETENSATTHDVNLTVTYRTPDLANGGGTDVADSFEIINSAGQYLHQIVGPLILPANLGGKSFEILLDIPDTNTRYLSVIGFFIEFN